MRFLYDLGIWFYGIILRIISPFHSKAKLWVEGRKNLLNRIEQTIERERQYIWFHFASLGEFEQGRSVIEQIKKVFHKKKLSLLFSHHQVTKFVKIRLWPIMFFISLKIQLGMRSVL